MLFTACVVSSCAWHCEKHYATHFESFGFLCLSISLVEETVLSMQFIANISYSSGSRTVSFLWLLVLVLLWCYCYYLDYQSSCDHSCSDSVAWVALFSLASVSGCVGVCLCQHDYSWTVWDIIGKFLWQQDMVRSYDELRNGCISMHWQILGGMWT